MNIKKIWFILCMAFICSFGLTACVTNEQAQKRIDVLIAKQADLSEKLVKAHEDYQKGTLTSGQLQVLKSELAENIAETKSEVEKLREGGVGWGELIASTALGLISRGIPSKGPLAALFGVFTARREESS